MVLQYELVSPGGTQEGEYLPSCSHQTAAAFHIKPWGTQDIKRGYWPLDSWNEEQSDDFREARVFHLPIHRKTLHSLTWVIWLSLIYNHLLMFRGFPGGSAGKESACNAEDLGPIPGLERSPGEGKGYPLQYSGLENSKDCIVHGAAKSWTRLSDFTYYYRKERQKSKMAEWGDLTNSCEKKRSEKQRIKRKI